MRGQQLHLDGTLPDALRVSIPPGDDQGHVRPAPRRPLPVRPTLHSWGPARVVQAPDAGEDDRDLRELAWSWGFAGPVLAVLSEDPGLLMGSDLSDARTALERASIEDDLVRAMDYSAQLHLPTVSWALRVRRFGYLRRFGDEVVLRSSTESHQPSEAQKILTHTDAAERYLFAWATENEQGFAQWVALDLTRLRRIWADPDRRDLLHAHEVRLQAGSRGLALPIASLIAGRVVIRALLARPSFESVEAAERFLAGCHALGHHPPSERRSVAVFLHTNALDTRYFVGPDPL